MADDDILTDLEAFNEAMVQFKEAVDGRGTGHCDEGIVLGKDQWILLDLERMPTIFNQLLTILKHIIEAYRLNDSVDVLEYAAKLIHLFQGLPSLARATSHALPMLRSSFDGEYQVQSRALLAGHRSTGTLPDGQVIDSHLPNSHPRFSPVPFSELPIVSFCRAFRARTLPTAKTDLTMARRAEKRMHCSTFSSNGATASTSPMSTRNISRNTCSR